MPAVYTLQVTVTGTAGPGNTVTSAVFTNLASFKVDVVKHMLELVDNNGKVNNISIDAAATFTVTVTSGNYVVSIS